MINHIPILILLGCATVACAEQFEISVVTVPDPWLVEEAESNTVTFGFDLMDEPAEEFTVTATNCGSSDDYSIDSTDDVTDMKIVFTNNNAIEETTFCAQLELEWVDEGAEAINVASLTFEMDVTAPATGSEEATIDTPETTVQVNPNDESVNMAMTVEREPPEIELAMLNADVIYFGEDISIILTSPSPGFEFQLSSVKTATQDLAIKDAGPGASGVIFIIDGTSFDIQDFVGGAPITLTLTIQWSVVGFTRRKLVESTTGTNDYELQVTILLPEDADASITAAAASYQNALHTFAFAATLAWGMSLLLQ